MSPWILSAGRYLGENLDTLRDQPDFRRATRNMLMAYRATESCLESVKRDLLEIRGKMAVVVATSHGELESTVDFLKELSVNQTARPFLFQSSLHNATLGFLTKCFSLTGPGLTVSDVYHSGEEALKLAEILLEKTVEYCLVVGVDLLVPGIEKPFELMYPQGTFIGEGAGALLLAKNRRNPCLGRLKAIRRSSTPSPQAIAFRYDSYAIEAIAEHLGKQETVAIQRPDGTVSSLHWERVHANLPDTL